jgi:hypothetical protein
VVSAEVEVECKVLMMLRKRWSWLDEERTSADAYRYHDKGAKQLSNTTTGIFLRSSPMFHSASAIRRCFAQSVLLGRRSGSTSLAYRHVVAQRNIILSAILRETTGRHDPLDSAVSQSEGLRPTRRRYLNRTSLHISKIPSDTTDEEFRQAFSVLPGLVNSELGGPFTRRIDCKLTVPSIQLWSCQRL